MRNSQHDIEGFDLPNREEEGFKEANGPAAHHIRDVVRLGTVEVRLSVTVERASI